MTQFPDFGKWLTLSEAIKSQTATRKGINNMPTQREYDNMVRLYNAVYVPICERFGKLPVSSFFRCPALNKAVGGSATSDHVQGRAIDIDCDGLGEGYPTNKELFEWVRTHLEFDQVIQEFPDADGNPGWVHVGYRSPTQNRKRALKAVSQNGKTIYEVE
ncbi:peptidase M15A [Fibrella aestuarina BUZ 2]|uniref:Peptidase M15A n=1 Tax=Fibrella aestuarina BUZ 2 TaxID=1166018 RepID=I0K6S1_9BACT|nr:D-Ala-D-Ala carboxypeptidase family metallohydrolase [Fibrella aestuarina]CCG99824.1 peptidase M15A [Fibrella aestuarina BUZ 2]